MTITASVVADSISPDRIRLTSVLCRYPRFAHAELMTHRVFSRNASSSRAIPVQRMIDDIKRDTAMPIHWGKNQKGMQADEENNEPVPINEHLYWGDDLSPQNAWMQARDVAIDIAESFAKAGYHKQIVNRLLEPFAHITVLITSTDWDNFFELRDHPDAQPEMQELARAIKASFAASKPQLLRPDEWHLPFISDRERENYDAKMLVKLSVARCARTSYLTHEGKKPDVEHDLRLYDQLVGSSPIHASPAEHQATPDIWVGDLDAEWGQPNLHGNLRGWVQNRKLIERSMSRKAA